MLFTYMLPIATGKGAGIEPQLPSHSNEGVQEGDGPRGGEQQQGRGLWA